MNVLVLSNEILGSPYQYRCSGGACGDRPRGDRPCGGRLCSGPLFHLGVFASYPRCWIILN